MSKTKFNPREQTPHEKIRIAITEKGPYMVFGRPPLAIQTITLDPWGACRDFEQGREFALDDPAALCRCGASGHKPYCDGSHSKASWEPSLTADDRPLMENTDDFEGGDNGITLSDNERYCVFARFCQADGNAWDMAVRSDEPEARRTAVREASLCPGSRLTAWDNRTGEPYEPHYEPSLGLIEDPAINASGGLWVRGGIAVERPDGSRYEIRNRVVLCRCGRSANKPYCDGTHAATRWQDGIENTTAAQMPEKQTSPAQAAAEETPAAETSRIEEPVY